MDNTTYTSLSIQEEKHWWFRARRKIVSRLIESCDLPEKEEATILEAGCGSGGNLRLLRQHGQLFAFELHDPSRQMAEKKTDAKILPGALPDELPFKILITVPAMPWLWSEHDVKHHHYRRYTKLSLLKVAQDADLNVVSKNYFNFFLFPLAVIKRISDRLLNKKDESADKTPHDLINHTFSAVFSLEKHLVTRIPIPFGLSLCMVLSKEP